MAAIEALVPARFLVLTAHLIINIVLFWSLEFILAACAARDDELSLTQDSKSLRTRLLIGLSISLFCTVTEIFGLLCGFSLLYELPAVFSIAMHFIASICLSLIAVQFLTCDDFWYIFGFCSVLPFLLEVIVIVKTLRQLCI